MSSIDPDASTDPEHNLTPAEIENLDRLEGVVQHGLGTYALVANALGEIRDGHLYRDTHPSFETYVRERWGLAIPNGHPLAQATIDVEIRFAIHKPQDPAAPADGSRLDPWGVAEPTDDELLRTLRWLLTQASGTIGDVAHQLENRAADLGDDVRAQLRDDVLVLDGELAVVKSLLLELVDWDAELERLLQDERPIDTDADPEDEE